MKPIATAVALLVSLAIPAWADFDEGDEQLGADALWYIFPDRDLPDDECCTGTGGEMNDDPWVIRLRMNYRFCTGAAC